jgi:ATP-dependent helicase Lhr and Lhr-like helicase
VLTVAPDPSGRPPRFESGRPMVHERVRVEMRRLVQEEVALSFLDAAAQGLLAEARQFYRDARLAERMVVRDGKAVLLLPWAGDSAQNALVLLLRSLGLASGENEGLVVRCEGWNLDRLSDACSDIVNLNDVDLLGLLNEVENLGLSKWDWALPRELLVRSYASMHLDFAGAKAIAAEVVASVK